MWTGEKVSTPVEGVRGRQNHPSQTYWLKNSLWMWQQSGKISSGGLSYLGFD